MNPETISSETKSYTDLSYLKKISRGDQAFMMDMISVFIADMPQTLNRLDSAFMGKKWPELKIIAHTMKSGIDFMGIYSIKETVKNIENYADKETCLELLPALIEKTKFTCLKALEELKAEINLPS